MDKPRSILRIKVVVIKLKEKYLLFNMANILKNLRKYSKKLH